VAPPRSPCANAHGQVLANISLDNTATTFFSNLSSSFGGPGMVGFNVTGIFRGAALALQSILITSPVTIAQCIGRGYAVPLVEPPSSIDSGAPVSYCPVAGANT